MKVHELLIVMSLCTISMIFCANVGFKAGMSEVASGRYTCKQYYDQWEWRKTKSIKHKKARYIRGTQESCSH